ncbi:dihydrofolate reductase [Paenibacillus macquariensis]|uniref:Dihydrofolate reductase n=1 Tax=Paenibacillus macquariensis TaxID=948756 RepID=A0ABY1JUX6_9BACL|nr:dihydrofolate reductase [Paenibacillus macquariensis]MEC0090886.1 dihydrofolate reductase [Paenibacillus macquariensis]OAB34617.1 dihydrofolate reductase [Paenibacillus macquariensis subsp. macquariensis]SIQ81335.1 dihydrofolate reductase [Paenibacillus macquariensis]
MGITMIWAMGRNGVMGKDNGMPWRLPRDMAFFKEQTIGKPVVMGRKTWESFGGRPLKDRTNIVMTRDSEYTSQDAQIIHSLEEALEYANNQELMIIGGAQIYEKWLPYADRLLVTRIDEDFEGDTVFPDIDWTCWNLSEEIPGVRDEKNPYDYRFYIYNRNNC